MEQLGGIEFFSSGSTLLDLALGGGWALGRVFNIVGDASSGKTGLCVEAFANFKVKYPTGKMRYAESESAFDEIYAEILGFPKEVERPDDLLNTVEDFQQDFFKFISNPGPSLYILDSLDALSDEAELKKFDKEMKSRAKIKDEEEEEGGEVIKGDYGVAKAKKMSKLFRTLNGVAAEANCTLGIVSQTRDKIGVMFGEKQTRSGGKALDFYASQILWLREIKKLERAVMNESRPVGVSVSGKVKKCKVGFPFREADFNIIFGYGIDDESSMLNWLSSIKQMNSEAVQQTKKELGKARDTRDLAKIKEIATQLRADATVVWKKIEKELMPTTRKYSEIVVDNIESVTRSVSLPVEEVSAEANSSPRVVIRSNDWQKRFSKDTPSGPQ